MPLREKAQQFAARDCIQRVNATQKIRAMPNSQPQRVPHGVDFGFGGGGHAEDFWPWSCEAFGGPFAGGVDAHLAAVVGQTRSAIERIDGAQGELNVALRIILALNAYT